MAFRIFFSIVVLSALVALGFFVVGLVDGSVSSRNMGIWMALLSVSGGGVAVCAWLNAAGQRRWATTIAGVLALPGTLYALFILLVVFSGQRWN